MPTPPLPQPPSPQLLSLAQQVLDEVATNERRRHNRKRLLWGVAVTCVLFLVFIGSRLAVSLG